MTKGIATTNVNVQSALDEVLGNKKVDGVESTVRVPLRDLASQIRSSEPFEDVENSTVALDQKLDSSISMLDGKIDSSISTLNTKIDDLSITGDTVTKATWAQLLASPGSRAGQRGLVEADLGTHTDPVAGSTVSNQGVYTWSGSAWQWLRFDDYATLKAHDVSKYVNSLPLIVDRRGLLGGGAAIYVGLDGYVRNPGTTYLRHNFTSLEDPKMPGYIKVPITFETGTEYSLYLDRNDATTPFKVAKFPNYVPQDPSRYVLVASLYGRNGYSSNIPVHYTDDFTGSAFFSTHRICADTNNTKLYIPRLSGYRAGSGAWYMDPLNEGDLYRELSVPSGGGYPCFVYINTFDLIKNGSRSPTALQITSGGFSWDSNPWPSNSAPGLVLLGTWMGAHFIPASHNVQLANTSPNMCPFSREDNDLCDLVYHLSEPVDLKSPMALEMGFTRGFASSNGNPFYGAHFPVINSGNFFCRFFVETEKDNYFGPEGGARVYLIQRAADGSESYRRFTAIFVKQHSPRVAEFVHFNRFSDGLEYTGAWGGVWGSADNPDDLKLKVFGYQHYAGANDGPFVRYADYPRAAGEITNRIRRLEKINGDTAKAMEPLLPSTLYRHASRPYDIYVDQVFGLDVRSRYKATISSMKAGVAAPVIVDAGHGSFSLNDHAFDDVVDFTFTDMAGNRSQSMIYRLTSKTLVPSAISAVNAKTLILGDSLNDYNGCYTQTIGRLRDMGATVTTIGTMEMTSEVPGDTVTELGEARSGREFADFVYMHTDAVAPVAAGGEAAYLALTKVQKREWNPFLKVPNADDTANRANMIQNGYIFDMRYYLTRFSLPDPDLVNINLGTNDESQQTVERALLQVQEGLRIIVSQTRRALPNAKIVLTLNALGRYQDETRWETKRRNTIHAHLKFARELNDPNLIVVPGYCLINRDVAYKYTSFTDPATGMINRTLSDGIHYGEAGLRQYGEINAQFFAGILTNP